MSPSSSGAPSTGGAGMRLLALIIDDSLTVRMDLAGAFGGAGYVPVLCSSLREAREVLARDRVAVIVLDVLLPDGDGVQFLGEIRADRSTAPIPVLLLSTEAEVGDRIRGLQVGADDYVGKPYDSAYVVARAGELVRRGEQSPGGGGSTILLIDDSMTFREQLRRTLLDAGYSVLVAPNGEEGLRVAATSRPALVVVDGVMPGIDGTTVIRKIRLDAALRATPCVLLTGSEGATAELGALDAGADAFIRKGEEAGVILARLAALLRGTEAKRQAGSALLGPKRVMAVDDDPSFARGIAAQLHGEGYDVVVAHSGEQALELLSIQPVDCILLDGDMPGIGGHETCRRIKESAIARDTPLVLVTADESPKAVLEALAVGADDCIGKLTDFEVLNARVRAQMRRKQIGDEQRKIREDLLRAELAAAEERARRELAEAKAVLVEELEGKNKELEAFSYSLSHDLRAPLRAIDGFSLALLEDYGGRFDENGRRHLQRVRAGAQRMGELIDDMLQLARVGRAQLRQVPMDMSQLGRDVMDDLRHGDPSREVRFVVEDGLLVEADRGLLRIVLENLLGNAWKFTSKVAEATIELGRQDRDGAPVHYVRDNGAGFDAAYVEKLFHPFQRLHLESEFPGTGIGLATVHRIVERHGGRIWADGAKNRGAVFFFTLPQTSRGRRLGET